MFVSAPTTSVSLPYDGQAIPFEGKRSGDRINGSVQLGPVAAGFTLKRVRPVVPPYKEVPIIISHGKLRLSGTAFIPRGPGPFPAVVFQQSANSGDRSEWYFMADWFARHGVIGLIYDSRGTGGSNGEHRSTFDELAEDGAAGLHLLRKLPSVDKCRVGLFAVSQGGWVASIVGSRPTDAPAFIIMRSGPGTSIDRTVLYEAASELKARGFPAAEVREAVAAKARIERMIVAGLSDDRVDAERAKIIEKPWFKFIGIMPRGHWWRGWWRKVGAFDPSPYWRRVRVPVLNMYGDRDVELSTAESFAAMDAAFAHGRKEQLTQHVFAGADHSLSIMRGVRPVLAPGAMDFLTDWVMQHVLAKPGAISTECGNRL